jgi:hypothetical protein
MADVTLYGIVELAPAAPTTYDCFASSGTGLEQTNEVRVYVDTTLAAATINLPAISSYNGIWNVKLWIIDVAGNASGNNIIVAGDVTAGDLICSSVASAPSITISTDNSTFFLEIANSGKWFANGI